MSIDLPEEAIDANITLTGNTRIEQTSPEVVLPDFSRAIRFEKLLKALEIPQLMMGGSSSEEETFWEIQRTLLVLRNVSMILEQCSTEQSGVHTVQIRKHFWKCF